MKKPVYYALIGILLVVFAVSAFFVVNYFVKGNQQANQFDDISQLASNPPTPEATTEATTTEPTTEATAEDTTEPTTEAPTIVTDPTIETGTVNPTDGTTTGARSGMNK